MALHRIVLIILPPLQSTACRFNIKPWSCLTLHTLRTHSYTVCLENVFTCILDDSKHSFIHLQPVCKAGSKPTWRRGAAKRRVMSAISKEYIGTAAGGFVHILTWGV